MKKNILTVVMFLSLLYIGLIKVSYAEDLANDLSGLIGKEMTEEKTLMIFAQEKSTVGNYEFQESYDTKKVEEQEKDNSTEEEGEIEEEDDDDNGAGVGLERRKDKRIKKALKRK